MACKAHYEGFVRYCSPSGRQTEYFWNRVNGRPYVYVGTRDRLEHCYFSHQDMLDDHFRLEHPQIITVPDGL